MSKTLTLVCHPASDDGCYVQLEDSFFDTLGVALEDRSDLPLCRRAFADSYEDADFDAEEASQLALECGILAETLRHPHVIWLGVVAVAAQSAGGSGCCLKLTAD